MLGKQEQKHAKKPEEPIVVAPCFNSSESMFRVFGFTAITAVVTGGLSTLVFHFVVTAEYTSNKKAKLIVK